MGLLHEHKKTPVTAIIAAGGTGSRLGVVGGKQLLLLSGRPVLAWSIDAIAAASLVGELIVACDPERVLEYEKVIRPELFTTKPVRFVGGGNTRQKSVSQALLALGPEQAKGIVLIHDGARPLVKTEEVDAACLNLIETRRHDAEPEIAGYVFGQPSVDTIKRVGSDEVIDETLKRSELWCAQTPQLFWGSELVTAYDLAEVSGVQGTDDASLVEHLGRKVKMVATSRTNIKITHQEDVALAEYLLSRK